MKEKSKKQPLSFEEAVERLENIIVSMEEGNIPLDELLVKYEEGTKMLKLAEERLKKAELKIELLRNDKGGTALEPFGSGRAD